MAKSIQEKIVETHTIKVTGTLNVDDMTIETEDEGVCFIQDLLANADNKHGVLSFQAKEEKFLYLVFANVVCFL